MNLLWPWFLLLLIIIPLLVGVYVWLLRRRRRYAVRYSSLSLVREALPRWARWRRHLPFALFLLGLVALIAALARPVAQVDVPLSRTTIILALDVSRSMCATDVFPNRLTVAQEAALAFVEEQPAGTQIGLVAFAGFAEIIVPPTKDKETLQNAIGSFTTSLGTTIGNATLKSIDAIATINPEVIPSSFVVEPEANESDQIAGEESYQPDIIVLLTDGANSQGAHPLDAAQQAADRRIRVYTIGFGSSEPGRMVCSQQQLGSDTFSGFSGSFSGGNSGWRRYLVIDEPTLQAVAEMTGGSYYRAENADQLLEVFRNLPTQITLQKEMIEISVFFSMGGTILATIAVALSLWRNRFP